MSIVNLHRNSTESNKHTPKGFDLATNNSKLIRDERGESRYTDNNNIGAFIDFVDGHDAPPTTTNNHVYILVDLGNGAVDAGWGSADYDDIVRFFDTLPVAVTPNAGYFGFNIADNKYYRFTTSWAEFVPESVNLGNSDLTQNAGEDREYNLNSRYLAFLNSLRLSASGNRSLSQFSQNFTTSVDDTQMENNSIAPLLDNSTLDLYWKYKNNMAVVSDLFAKVDKSKVYGGLRYTLIKPNGTQQYYNLLTDVRSNWADGDVLHQFADEQITYSSSAIVDGRLCMFSLPSIQWNGNGFTLDLIGTVTNAHDYFTAFNKNVTFFKLNFIFNGTAGANRSIIRATGTSVIKGSYSTDISATNEIDRFLVNTNAEAYNFISLLNGFTGSIINGSGKAYNFTIKNGLYSTNGSVSVFNFKFINYGNIWGTSKIYNSDFYYANYRITQNQRVEFYNCYFEVTGTPSASSPIFQYTGGSTWKAKFFDCEIRTTSTNDVFQCDSTGAGNHELKNVKIYSSGRIGTFNSAGVVIENCHFEALGGNAISSTDTGYTKFIRKSYIKSSENVINTGVWDITDTTLETTNSASFCLPNQPHKLVNLTFIGSNAPVNSNVFATSPDRLLKSIDYLGNVGHGLRSHFAKMTTAERDALTGVEKGYAIENTTTNFLQVYNGSTWKDLLDLT